MTAEPGHFRRTCAERCRGARAERRRSAFSLAELLAVVVVLGVASAIALPQLGDQDDSKVASASRELTADLLYAQSCAITTGRTHYIVFDAIHGNYSVMDSIVPPHIIAHPVQAGRLSVVIGHGPLAGVFAREIDFDGTTTLAFDALGTPWSYLPGKDVLSPLRSGSILLAKGAATRTISIQPFTGQIRVK
jgi:prepilin-type N-terminal cleavage/methylation domain-containing protein